MDVVHEGAKSVEHRRYTVLGVIITLLVVGWITGCPATTQSVLNPDLQVDAEGLRREATIVDSYVAQLEVAAADIESKVARRKKIIETIGALGMAATTGNPAAAGIIGAILTIGSITIGTGAVLDKRRTDRVLKKKNKK